MPEPCTYILMHRFNYRAFLSHYYLGMLVHMRSSKLKNRKQGNSLVLAFKFVALFLVFAGISYFAILPTRFPNQVAAVTSQLSLKWLFNIDSEVVSVQSYPGLATPNMLASIVDLCSGKLEIAILIGIIFGSFEKRLDYRLKGFLAGLLVLLVFNALRISTTIYFLNSGDAQWAASLHDVLFRIFLIVAIVTFYTIWYFYDKPRSRRESRKG